MSSPTFAASAEGSASGGGCASTDALQAQACQRAIDEASFSSTACVLTLPWEKGVFKRVFEGESFGLPKIPKVRLSAQLHLPAASAAPKPAAASTDETAGVSDPIYASVLTRPRLEPGVKAGSDREAVVRRWLCILSHCPEGSELGKFLMNSSQDTLQIVSSAVGGKATSTLLKRARCAAKLVAHASTQGTKFFPITLDKVLDYIKPLVAARRRSAIHECFETINFLEHVLGVQVEAKILEHPVIQGIKREASGAIRLRTPSRTLYVAEIFALECELIEGFLDPIDRYALGVCLFLVYARARVSDIRNIYKIELDTSGNKGYIEVKTFDHKNARISNAAGVPLILVAPIQGLHKSPWGLAFIAAGKEVGFNFEQGFRGPLLPTLAADNSWSSAAVSASEVTIWMRKLLALALVREPEAGFSSHGLKATLLSWMTKAGYDKIPCLILGHHALKGDHKPIETYGRDTQAHPLRLLEQCIERVRSGVFSPDSTRSGMMLDVPVPLEPVIPAPPLASSSSEQVEKQVEPPLAVRADAPSVEGGEPCDQTGPSSPTKPPVCSSSQSSSSSSSSSGSDSENIEYESLGQKDVLERFAPCATMGVDLELFQTPTTKSLHARARGSDGPLLCGRALLGKVPFAGRVYSKTWLCKQCVKARPIRDAGSSAAFLDKAMNKDA